VRDEGVEKIGGTTGKNIYFPSFFTVLGEWLFGLHFVAEDNGNGTLPMMKTQEMVKTSSWIGGTEWVQGTKTTQIGNFVVNPGVPFELHIDVPSGFVKKNERAEQVEMEHYRAEMRYAEAKLFGVLQFGLNRKYFPLWQIQAINVSVCR
jgi:hypothetical protein